jgi:hypothetical protein
VPVSFHGIDLQIPLVHLDNMGFDTILVFSTIDHTKQPYVKVYHKTHSCLTTIQKNSSETITFRKDKKGIESGKSSKEK